VYTTLLYACDKQFKGTTLDYHRHIGRKQLCITLH